MSYKGNIINLPTYHDGIFKIFEIKQTEDNFPIEFLQDTQKFMYFKELSIFDSLKFEASERRIKITKKIRVPQMKELTSLHVLKIGEEYHKIYNAYHFTNKNGFKETDLTLEEYKNPKMEEEI